MDGPPSLSRRTSLWAAGLPLALVAPLLWAPAAHPAAAEPPSVPAEPVQLVIDTDEAAPISRDDYVPGSMQLAGVTHRMEIRGRGNSTWAWTKKPYKVKLEDDAGLLGMPETNEWVLLANYADRSALRTQTAFDLARRTRLGWTPRTRYVDVVLNGQSLGLYTLTEQVELGSGRVELPDGGHLLEVDKRFRRSGEPGFRSGHGIPLAFKDPDEVTRKQRRAVKGAVRQFEEVLYSREFAHPRRGYRALVDVGTFLDWYLVEELFGNQGSDFRTSVHLTWTPGGRFALGPVWDFDLSAGTRWEGVSSPEGWYTRVGRHWIARMLEDPAFSEKVKTRWARLLPQVDEVLGQIPEWAAAIRSSALEDWTLWHDGDEQVEGSVHADSFDGEVGFLQEWLDSRVEWLSRPEVGFARTSWAVRERPRRVRIPVRLVAPADQPVSVSYAWHSGTATRGKDFRLTDGTLVFQPGETVKAFRVRILDDRRLERVESINLALTATDPGSVLGSPARVRLRIAANNRG